MNRIDRVRILFKNAAEKGLLLLLASLLAIIIVNFGGDLEYKQFLHTIIGVSVGEKSLKLPVLEWINDFLMVIFFFAVGMEIKRELIGGYLANKKQRILPVVAAASGVVFPVIIYGFINKGNMMLMKGWAIPAATDIAFAIGMLSLLGKGIPMSLRIFLTALAIIDDLIAICIIAVFYTDQLVIGHLFTAACIIAILYFYAKSKLFSNKIAIMAGIVLWSYIYASGIHSTISGVIFGLLMPLNHPVRGNQSPLIKMEDKVYPVTTYLILPLFAFANSGMKINIHSVEELTNPITMGVAMGLFFGKQIGVMFAAFILRVFKLLMMPVDASWLQLYGVSLLCGIGFTMSLFIGILSFAENHQLFNQAQLGVFIGSIISALMGALVLKISKVTKHDKKL